MHSRQSLHERNFEKQEEDDAHYEQISRMDQLHTHRWE